MNRNPRRFSRNVNEFMSLQNILVYLALDCSTICTALPFLNILQNFLLIRVGVSGGFWVRVEIYSEHNVLLS